MEALEELAVSYERQDGEMEASNEEKAALQCEIEKMQVGSHVTHTLFNHLLNRVSTMLGLRYLYTGTIYILYYSTMLHFIISILCSIVRVAGENTAVFGHSGSWRPTAADCY